MLLSVLFFQDAPHLTIDVKLKHILKSTTGGSLQYVVIEGNGEEADVRCYQLERPALSLICFCFFLMCMHSSGAVQPVGEALTSTSKNVDVGVLQKFTLSEHRLVWNSFTRSW